MFWIYLLAAFAVLFGTMYLMDRSAKRKGHQMRDPGAMSRLANDGHRDAEAINSAPLVGTTDTTWTAYSRHNAGHGELSLRENDENDDPHLKRDPHRPGDG